MCHGAGRGARTHDPEITNHVLCQLSYTSRDLTSFSNSLLSITTNLYPFFCIWAIPAESDCAFPAPLCGSARPSFFRLSTLTWITPSLAGHLSAEVPAGQKSHLRFPDLSPLPGPPYGAATRGRQLRVKWSLPAPWKLSGIVSERNHSRRRYSSP